MKRYRKRRRQGGFDAVLAFFILVVFVGAVLVFLRELGLETCASLGTTPDGQWKGSDMIRCADGISDGHGGVYVPSSSACPGVWMTP